MNRAMIRARIDALECLTDTQQAIDDVSEVTWDPHEAQAFDLTVTTNGDKQGVTFIHNLPPSVLLAGLRAMEAALCEMSGMEVVA